MEEAFGGCHYNDKWIWDEIDISVHAWMHVNWNEMNWNEMNWGAAKEIKSNWFFSFLASDSAD